MSTGVVDIDGQPLNKGDRVILINSLLDPACQGAETTVIWVDSSKKTVTLDLKPTPSCPYYEKVKGTFWRAKGVSVRKIKPKPEEDAFRRFMEKLDLTPLKDDVNVGISA